MLLRLKAMGIVTEPYQRQRYRIFLAQEVQRVLDEDTA